MVKLEGETAKLIYTRRRSAHSNIFRIYTASHCQIENSGRSSGKESMTHVRESEDGQGKLAFSSRCRVE